MSNFSPNVSNCKIFQKFEISQLKVINFHEPDDFCLANFKFLADLNLKLGEKLAIIIKIFFFGNSVGFQEN
jgi:hypothetical protein